MNNWFYENIELFYWTCGSCDKDNETKHMDEKCSHCGVG